MSTSENLAGQPGKRGPAGPEGTAGKPGKRGPAGPEGPVMDPGTRQAFKRLLWAIVVLFIITFAIGAANLLFTNSQVHKVQQNSEIARKLAQSQARIIARQAQQIIADCGFYRDLAGLPLTSINGHPSKLGVQVVSDSRGAWHGHGCPGTLPPPDPTFVAGAKLYGLPVN